jgi:hypothetical protein
MERSAKSVKDRRDRGAGYNDERWREAVVVPDHSGGSAAPAVRRGRHPSAQLKRACVGCADRPPRIL